MRRRIVIGGAALAALVVAGAAGAYAYDRAKADVVANGVRIAGVDVGGMTSAEARRAVRTRLVPRLVRPIVVDYRGRRFVLEAAAVGVDADVEGAVAAALAASRDGTLVERLVRRLTSETVRAHIPLEVDYSGHALDAFIRRIEREVERRPRDARIRPTARSLRLRPSRPGVAVRAAMVRRTIAVRLRDANAPRRIPLPVERTRPRVTTAKLRRKYPVFITISRSEKRLRLFRRLRLAKTYVIAVGQAGYETPSGLHRVYNKAVNPAWNVPNRPWAGSLAGTVVPAGSPLNPIRARWLGFYRGAGIHGTDDVGSLGSAASHGCIRMSVPDVIELYGVVPVRTPVYIA